MNIKHGNVIGVVCISPNNSTHTKGLTQPVWDIIEEELLQFVDNEQIILIGDFNARTGSLPDYIVNVDYFISSTELFDNVRYMVAHGWLPCLSDHYPVSVCLNTGTRRNPSLDKKYEKEMAPS